MNEKTAKICFKIGNLEVECEGTESFLKNDLSNILDKILSLSEYHDTAQGFDSASSPEKTTGATEGNPKTNLSMGTIAPRMNVKSGPDLAMAAAVCLTFVESKTSFSRREIDEKMKEASNFYKKSMSSNLTATLSSLVKNKHLNEIKQNLYALTASQKEQMEKSIAEWY